MSNQEPERVKQIVKKDGTVLRKTKTRSGDFRYYSKGDNEDTFTRTDRYEWGGAHNSDYYVDTEDSSMNQSGQRLPRELDQKFDEDTLREATKSVKDREDEGTTTRTISSSDTGRQRSIKGIQHNQEFQQAVEDLFGNVPEEYRKIGSEALAVELSEEAGRIRREGGTEREIIDGINARLPQGIEFES